MTSTENPEPGNAQETEALTYAREVAESFRKSGQTDNGAQQRPPRESTTRRRPQREDATPLSEVLDQVMAEQGWDDRLSAARVFTDWESIVGSEVAQHCQIVGFDDSIVQVKASSTAWKKQLEFLAPQLVAKLNERLGDGSVLRVHVTGPKQASWSHGKRSVRGGRGPRDTYG